MTEQDIFCVIGISLITNYAMQSWRTYDPKTALRDAKINYLYQKAGLTFDVLEGLAPEIRLAVRRGQKIVAIKLYRDATGCGLKQAKDAVESVMRGEGQPNGPAGRA